MPQEVQDTLPNGLQRTFGLRVCRLLKNVAHGDPGFGVLLELHRKRGI